jgi:uncharacterized repeat protein (TIGR03803 family)
VVATFRTSHPGGALLDVGGTLYGTASGARHNGIFYSISPQGVKTVLHKFKGNSSDGAYPEGNLIDVQGTLYGTTFAGGTCGSGTVYSISKAGSDKVIKSFCGNSGQYYPLGGLLNVKGTLYGMTGGELFSITTSGSFKVLHVFGDGSTGADTNPRLNSGLVNVNGTIYGTTEFGGSGCTIEGHSSCGSVFSIRSDGTKLKLLHSFIGGSDGAFPGTGPIVAGGTLYGTTLGGGTAHNECKTWHGCGTVYSITTSGKEKVLYKFAGGSDGSNPNTTLLESGGTLYGATEHGGGMNLGTVFAMGTSGNESVLHSFDGGGSDGRYPDGALIEMNDVLYGTTFEGGQLCLTGGRPGRTDGCGVVYALNGILGSAVTVNAVPNTASR